MSIIALVLAVLDLGAIFSEPKVWETDLRQFVAEHQVVGFRFASNEGTIANCMKKGATAWNSYEVWEARVYGNKAGKIERLELSLYNRGDAEKKGYPAISEATLNQIVEGISGEFPKALKSPPKQKLPSGGQKFVRRFSSDHGEAEVTWGVTDTTVEFVRLTLGKSLFAASAPKAIGADKAKAKSKVQKNAEGDTWIAEVPMVDQGAKGYCAAAVAERVLRYYGKQVDEHEIAQIAGSSAEKGTSTTAMKETVKLLASKFRLGFNDIVDFYAKDEIRKTIDAYNKAAKSLKAEPLAYESFVRNNTFMVPDFEKAMNKDVLVKLRTKDSRYKKFLATVKKRVDEGVPIFWGVNLGHFLEPGLPQLGGGHMRLIIGYNQRTGEILYTDTWGAGHELKRMPQERAFAITHNAFTLRPL